MAVDVTITFTCDRCGMVESFTLANGEVETLCTHPVSYAIEEDQAPRWVFEAGDCMSDERLCTQCAEEEDEH